jgi:hypothetical protein
VDGLDPLGGSSPIEILGLQHRQPIFCAMMRRLAIVAHSATPCGSHSKCNTLCSASREDIMRLKEIDAPIVRGIPGISSRG